MRYFLRGLRDGVPFALALETWGGWMGLLCFAIYLTGMVIDEWDQTP